MLPVISFDIKYKNPGRYDELLTVKTKIVELPKVRFHFEFEVWNEDGKLITTAKSTVVFVNKENRYPMIVPDFILSRLQTEFLNE